MFKRTLMIAPLAALLIGAAPPSPPSPPSAATIQSGNRIHGHIEFLADDLLEGRDTGSRGHAIAAVYVASQFRALGLAPGGERGSWYQQVPFRTATHADPEPQVTLIEGGRRIPLKFGVDAGLRPSVTRETRALDTALVFVGYGLDDARLGLSDYRGLDVRGKTVVALSGIPAGLPTEIAAHLASQKEETAARLGAVGYIEVPLDTGIPRGPGVGSFAHRPLFDWVDAAGKTGNTPPGLVFNLRVSREYAGRLFNGSRQSLAAIRTATQKGKGRPTGFPLASRIAINAKSKWQDFTSPEVIGVLPGRDPTLRDEYVVLMGHLDHLGIKPDAKPGEDAIYNGALDNAAGVATMLEAARLFVESGKRPLRSVMFIANTGEEKGLLGADYFARHPTVPIGKIVSLVDLDMPLPLYDFTDVTAFGADHSTVAKAVAEAGRAMGITVSPDPMPQETIFVRSDHYRFVLRGVPAILLFTGYANGGKAHWDHFLDKVYHTPADDLSQPINWIAAARYGELNYRIARLLADEPRRPLWYHGDYFGDTYAPGQPRAER
ncbi:MAG TPA: M20/M25/M40 family metallo-hydrolase [Sphingomicrobium sp.]|nr:M20/M25/M40 family metallo-hydrolase [Sphingomicrobium sp.]